MHAVSNGIYVEDGSMCRRGAPLSGAPMPRRHAINLRVFSDKRGPGRSSRSATGLEPVATLRTHNVSSERLVRSAVSILARQRANCGHSWVARSCTPYTAAECGWCGHDRKPASPRPLVPIVLELRSNGIHPRLLLEHALGRGRAPRARGACAVECIVSHTQSSPHIGTSTTPLGLVCETSRFKTGAFHFSKRITADYLIAQCLGRYTVTKCTAPCRSTCLIGRG